MFVDRESGRDLSKLIQPEVMGPPAVWLASPASDGFNGLRIVAAEWDDNLMVEDNLKKASAPAAWPQLGR